MVRINGEEKNIAGKTIMEYLLQEQYDLKFIAVERNGNIVKKTEYAQTVMEDQDEIEVVSFVGGG